MYFLVLLSILVSIEVSGAPPRDMVMPPLEFDLYHIKTPQLIGIIIGIIVFTTTIGVVIYLLHASGTLTNAWKEIVVDAKNASTINIPGKTQITSPFHSQPELYDHLLAAKENLPRRFDVGIITGKSVTLRAIVSNSDYQWLFEASNGSAQYHESAYDLAKVWGWHDVDISSCGKDNSVNNQPWSSVAAFKNWIALQEEEGVAHLVIEDNEYRKPIGLISVSNHRVRNLSINIGKYLKTCDFFVWILIDYSEYTWLTPAFQGLDKAHESYFLLLDHLFKLGKVVIFMSLSDDYHPTI